MANSKDTSEEPEERVSRLQKKQAKVKPTEKVKSKKVSSLENKPKKKAEQAEENEFKSGPSFELPKSAREKIVVEVSTFKDRQYLNIRSWFFYENTNEWRPSAKGVTIPLEKARKFIVGTKRLLAE